MTGDTQGVQVHADCAYTTRMTNRPRRVRLCRWAPAGSGLRGDKRGRGGRHVLYAFGWADLGALLGVAPETASKMAKAGRFDPADLVSIAEFWRCRLHRTQTA